MTETPENQFTIPVQAWAEFQAKIFKLNKKAAKLGCEPIVYTVIADTEVTRQHTYKNEDGEFTKSYKVPAKVIELTGAAPKLEGYRFIAQIEYLSDGKTTLFHTVPGCPDKVDERFRRLDPSVCEHCHKVRTRKDTFVVQKVDTGTQTQVGRQCLADFTGINSPQAIAAKAAWLHVFSDLREECERWFGERFVQCLDIGRALSLTSAYIAQVGWTPKSAASERNTATATLVAEHFWGLPTNAKARAALLSMAAMAEQPEHQERATKVLDWVKGPLADKARSDYELNLVNLVKGDLVEHRHLGIVCSAVAAYQRAMNQAVEYANKRKSLEASQHVGDQGKRLRDVAVKVHQVRALEANDFGPRTLVKFLDTAGNLLTWFASGDKDFTPGAQAVITGTVKCFKEYQGVKETQLSRVVVRFAEEAKA